MTRAVLLAAIVASAAPVASGQEDPSPRQCLAKRNDPAAVTVTHDAKTYHLASAACRDQFASDPERYSQLYDALIELEKRGEAMSAPASPSLVPS